MLAYALLMIMLYGGENKNSKTILIALALLAFLGGFKKRTRRRRGRRHRNRSGSIQDIDDADKAQLLLSAVQSVLNYLNVRAQSRQDQQAQQDEAVQSAGSSDTPGDDPKAGSNRAFRARSGSNKELSDEGTVSDSQEPQRAAVQLSANRDPEQKLPVAADPDGDNNKGTNNSDGEKETGLNCRHNQSVYRIDNEALETIRKDITEVILEIYQGVNITLSLSNGNTVSGEVVGLYHGILILRNAGIINYIKGEAIVSFS